MFKHKTMFPSRIFNKRIILATSKVNFKMIMFLKFHMFFSPISVINMVKPMILRKIIPSKSNKKYPQHVHLKWLLRKKNKKKTPNWLSKRMNLNKKWFMKSFRATITKGKSVKILLVLR